MNFETVIGLEVHCELLTKSKMFSTSPVGFGQEANTQVHVVDLAMTGTMPVLNKMAVEYALRVCHALHMEIDELVCFDRKNYYYADLPKGFQITQERRPIGRHGTLHINIDGRTKAIEIERLHMEEDTAKQLHFSDYTLLDYNRAGVPLIEIVTKPMIHSSKEAATYLEKLRQIFLYTGVSDAKMEEGSMRCDVNVSLRPCGSETFGQRTEIKNLNSISNVQKAIEYEVSRQKEILMQGKTVEQETMRYDEDTKQTVKMRAKGDAVDYQYYPEPNILPIRLEHQWVDNIKKNLPDMPDVRVEKYVHDYSLLQTEALILVATKEISDFFEETIFYINDYRTVCHWILGDVQAYLNKNNVKISQTKLTPCFLAKLIHFIKDGIISNKQGKKVFALMMEEGKDPGLIIEEKHMKQISDYQTIKDIVQEIVDMHPQSLEDYKNGKDRAVRFLIGQVMKKTAGQANPKITHEILIEILEQRIS